MEVVCAWQRRNIIAPLQAALKPLAPISLVLSEAPVLVVSLWISWFFVKQNQGAAGIWLVPIVEILNSFLKSWFRHPRPGWIAKDPVEFRQWTCEYSFPSSDMMLAMASSAYLFPDHPYTMAVVGTVVGINRMFVGAHYLHDVIIGAILGPAVTWAYKAYRVHETYIEPNLHSISGRVELVAMTLPICLVTGFLYLRALELKDPKEWEMKANNSHANFRPLDTTQAHLKQFSGMYGLLLSLIAWATPHNELEDIKNDTRNIYARILLGQFLVVGTFLTIAATSPKQPLWAMHICRAFRYASVPGVVMFACAPIFRWVGI